MYASVFSQPSHQSNEYNCKNTESRDTVKDKRFHSCSESSFKRHFPNYRPQKCGQEVACRPSGRHGQPESADPFTAVLLVCHLQALLLIFMASSAPAHARPQTPPPITVTTPVAPQINVPATRQVHFAVVPCQQDFS